MTLSASPLAAFHLIGDRTGLEMSDVETGGFRPALFGAYHDLSLLRTDFPVVLVNTPNADAWLKSLSDVVDELLQSIAEPGMEGEEIRRQVLAQEQAIRQLVAGGQQGTLSELWKSARNLRADTKVDNDELNLQRALEAINLDGDLVNCDRQLAARLVTRAWKESENIRSERLQTRIDKLAQKLSDILKVNFINSPEARQAGQLESAMGSGNQSVFDFQAMARVLKSAPAAEALPSSRSQRIQSAIDVLESQRFFNTAEGRVKSSEPSFGFIFNDGEKALKAFSQRLPEMAELVKAISIAELEIENHYNESRHDHFFEGFDEGRLGPHDLELFPSYLVCIDHADQIAQEQVLGILRSGLPFKVVAQTSDILGDDSLVGGQLSFGTQGQQLARMALGIDGTFVLQSAVSSLYRMKEAVFAGLSTTGPALFSIYCGSGYLESAAATESRAFPCFVYNPDHGPGQASRFSLAGNPSPGDDWPGHVLSYENSDHDYQSESTAFTLVDFIAHVPGFAGHFAGIASADWGDELAPVAEFLQLSGRAKTDKVPYVPLIDDDNTLYRAVVDEKLLDAARRCLDAWHNLQEMGGINNSHAAIAVAEARESWEEQQIPPTDQPVQASATTAVSPAAAPVADLAEPPQAAEGQVAPSSDDPWIETIRCTTCNECTQLNDRMFAYDGEMRAFIADPDAGTFRELVEAAETCQVAIIHPGKPRNPEESGLEELLERAAPFI